MSDFEFTNYDLNLLAQKVLIQNINYKKLLEFVKSISNHLSFSETEIDFIKFYAAKENEAAELLEEIGEI